jgi:hypothetical protein
MTLKARNDHTTFLNKTVENERKDIITKIFEYLDERQGQLIACVAPLMKLVVAS